jgi:hypothetical protein
MKTTQKAVPTGRQGFVTPLLLAIIAILLIGGGAYVYVQNKQSKQAEVATPSATTVTSDGTTNSEESSNEIFKNQPGAIKSIAASGNNNWQLAVDLLTRNPKWLPGVDSSGGFFLNENPKIRNLTVTKDTKTYNCGTGVAGTPPYILQNTASFISNIQNKVNKSGEEFGYTTYFDINGTNITAIYEQCLP